MASLHTRCAHANSPNVGGDRLGLVRVGGEEQRQEREEEDDACGDGDHWRVRHRALLRSLVHLHRRLDCPDVTLAILINGGSEASLRGRRRRLGAQAAERSRVGAVHRRRHLHRRTAHNQGIARAREDEGKHGAEEGHDFEILQRLWEGGMSARGGVVCVCVREAR